MKSVLRSKNVISISFDSIGSLLKARPSAANKLLFEALLSMPDPKFIGAKSADDVIRNAVMGNAELFKRLNEMSEELKSAQGLKSLMSPVKVRRRKLVRRSQGDEIDIHKVYTGNIDKAWTSRKHIVLESNRRLYTIFVDIGGSSSVGFNESLWRSAVANLLVNDLIIAGKSVRVIAGSSVSDLIFDNPSKIVTTAVVVKEYNEPMSLERLASCTHIGFHRVFSFLARAALDEKISYSMGRTSNYLAENPPLDIKKEQFSNYVHIGRATSKTQAEAELAALSWVG